MRLSAKTLVITAAATCLLTTPALGQPPTGAPPAASGAEAASASFSDREVKSFAVAAMQVAALDRVYSDRIRQATDDRKRVALGQEAMTQMTAVVEGAGLTPDTYNRIAAAAHEDAELRERIGQELQRAAPSAP